MVAKVKSRILRPFSWTIIVPFRVDFGHMRTAAETRSRETIIKIPQSGHRLSLRLSMGDGGDGVYSKIRISVRKEFVLLQPAGVGVLPAVEAGSPVPDTVGTRYHHAPSPSFSVVFRHVTDSLPSAQKARKLLFTPTVGWTNDRMSGFFSEQMQRQVSEAYNLSLSSFLVLLALMDGEYILTFVASSWFDWLSLSVDSMTGTKSFLMQNIIAATLFTCGKVFHKAK